MFAILLLGFLCTVIAVVIAYFKWSFTYWKRKGIPFLNPSIPFGNMGQTFKLQKTLTVQLSEVYRTMKNLGYHHLGLYFCAKPTYFPIDLNIIKHILQIDFQHFTDRFGYVNEKNDPLTGHLVSLKGSKWKHLRTKLTPTFSSAKMKMMFDGMTKCTKQLTHFLNEAEKAGGTVLDIKDVLSRFTIDVISSCAYGLESNALKDAENVFLQYSKKIFHVRPLDRFKRLCMMFIPYFLLDFIKLRRTNKDVEEFFIHLVKETVKYRETNNVTRKDFLQLLIQIKNSNSNLSLNEIAAQVYSFFIAGFETSATTMMFALYELAENLHIQDKLRAEIKSVLAKYDGELTYDAIAEMKYMDQVLDETLRKWPPIGTLFRACTKDYKIPNENLTLEKDTLVFISIVGLHYDPEYYENPEKFDPERFNPENNAKTQCTFLPFGEGPRNCIGVRFGLMQSKVGLTVLLKDFKFTLNEKTKTPLIMDKRSNVVQAPEGGIWLNIKKI